MSHLAMILIAALGAFALGCSKPATNGDDLCSPTCGASECGDDGCGGTCGTCSAGEACNDGICAPASCGNGVLDDGETCDPSAGIQCATEAGCEPLGACFGTTFSGAPESCDARCETTQIEECIDGDGCCPAACHPGIDRDCVPDGCGNGVVDPGETCDEPDFPCIGEDDCQPAHSCELTTLIGYDFACSVTCQRTEITSCAMVADGCCPENCTYRTDPDCPAPICGDGVVEEDELCDTGIDPPDEGACPADCEDNRACTTDLLNGEQCTASCSHATQSACTDGDGCCPPGCTLANDDDCNNVVCGDGVIDGEEGCDNAIPAGEPGACPMSDADCDDGDPCTTDTMVGDPSDCSARCVNDAIACTNGDGCCPFTCTANNDDECAALELCETMCFSALTYCMGENAIFDSTAECVEACRDMASGRPSDEDSNSVYCRISHLEDALADPETHCPHAAVDAPEGCIE